MSTIRSEKEIITCMIALYCRKKHKTTITCPDCRMLIEYAKKRLDKCPYGEEKPVCRKCPVHCYKKDMREKIREVMRFAGLRMLFYHPVVYLKHILKKPSRL